MRRPVIPPERDILTTIPSPSLHDNPLGASADRMLRVYLPPGYETDSRHYPVIYLLHGYGGDPMHPILDTRAHLNESYPGIVRWLFRGLFRRVLTFEALDDLILSGSLPPIILVQPDGSLHAPHRSGATLPGGDPREKGGMYYDSPGTGQFGSAVFSDVVEHVDSTWRTIPRREGRGIVGGSMGGYGALLAGIFRPETFSAIAALSPSICGLDILDITLVTPYKRWSNGRRGAVRIGAEDLADILETCDMVFSPDRPLVPTIRRGSDGRTRKMDSIAEQNWRSADAGVLAEGVPGAFRDVAIRVSCEEHDEFCLAGPDRRFAGVLERLGIPVETHFFSDRSLARVSGHAGGIAAEVESGLRFCLRNMVVSGS